jgi:hypothetical protein
MPKTAGYLLIVDDQDRANELLEFADDGEPFAESVPFFSYARHDWLIASSR